MTRVIAICNQKGGVGKTTTAINLSASIASLGKRVLVIDTDPQANASSGLGVARGSVETGMYEALIAQTDNPPNIIATEIPTLRLLPSTSDLSAAEVELVSEFSRETRSKAHHRQSCVRSLTTS
jgi:chromosome partitioning protein